MNTPEINVNNFKKNFEKEAVKVMRDFKVPGISVYITKDNNAIYERSFGLRESGKNVKAATKDTLYGVSSITKSITCFGILQLYEQEKLDINDPVSKYVPFELGFEENPILIKHLMSHSSGIPSLNTFYFSQKNQKLVRNNPPEFPMGNWDDFYFHVNDATSEVLSAPGTKYYYWNAGFSLLGKIIEKISGLKYEEYIEKNILTPLGMNRSTYSNKKAEEDGDASRGFNYGVANNEMFREQKDLLSGPFIAGSGGLISSVKEMTNYILCQVNGGEYKGVRILKEDLVKEMWQPHNKNIQAKYFHYYPDLDTTYGYGWKIYDNFFGYRLITHGGMSGVSGGWVGFIPELNLTYVQLQNVNWIPLHLMLKSFALLLGKNPDEEMPYFKKRKHMRLLSGRYESYKKATIIQIQNRNGLLYLTDENWVDKNVVPLIPGNDDPECMDYYVTTPYGKLDTPFTKHADGQITFEWERFILHKKTIELEED
ncbi:MAG: serine hydrolase [Candidatus Heimdallarchaeaceae archaeon]